MNDKECNEICRQLWDEHEQNIRKLCEFKFSGNPIEVDEIVSDTYLILCDTIKSNVNISNPRAWLYGIVNNIVKCKYRELKKRKEKQLFISELSVDLSYNIDLLDAMITDDDIEVLKEEIETELNEKEKELLKLVYEDKLTSKQIAKMKNSTEAAIKQRRFRLISRIKGMVKDKIKKFL